MANLFAIAAAAYSAGSTWSATAGGAGGAGPPGPGDTAHLNNRAVTLDVDATCDLITNAAVNGATAGGTLTLSGNRIITAALTAGTVTIITSSGAQNLDIIGVCTGGSSASARVVLWQSSGTCNVTGSPVLGGTSTSCPIMNNSVTGVVTITGDVTGSNVSGGATVVCAAAGTINIIGNVTGGSVQSAVGVTNSTTGTVNITGNCTAGAGGSVSYGALNSAGGTITVSGTATGGLAGADGVRNVSTGTVIVKKAKANGYGIGSTDAAPGYGVYSQNQGSISYVEEIEYGELGQTPTFGPIRLTDVTTNKAVFYRFGTTTKTLSDPNATAGLVPAEADVRLGVVYAGGVNTGSCAVPGAASVAFGAAIDATTGTATLSLADVRTALGMASANMDTQLAPLARLDTALVLDGAVYQFTANALELTPGGGGGGLDAAGVRAAVGLATANLDTQLAAKALEASVTAAAAQITNVQGRIPAALTAGGNMKADALAISGDTAAADALETMLDGSGGNVLTLKQLALSNNTGGPALLCESADDAGARFIGGAAQNAIEIVCDEVGSANAISLIGRIVCSEFSGAVGSVNPGGITALTLSAGALDAIADEIRTNLGTELGRIDANISDMAAPSEAENAAAIVDALTDEDGLVGVNVLAINSNTAVVASWQAILDGTGANLTINNFAVADGNMTLNTFATTTIVTDNLSVLVNGSLALDWITSVGGFTGNITGNVSGSVGSVTAPVTVSDASKNAIAAAIEVELANDATGGAFLQAIFDKLAAGFPDLDDLTIAAIANASRDAILNRVLAGNHDTTGTPGKLLQSLPSAGTVNTTEPPSAASIAAAVWASGARTLTSFGTLIADLAAALWAAAERTLTSGAAPSADAVASAVVVKSIAGAPAGSVGAALLAAGNAGDPWSATDLDGYPADSAGKILAKLNIGAPEDPVIVIPGPPADLTLCTVFGYLETIENAPAVGIEIIFDLVTTAPAKTERLLAGRRSIATTDAAGYFAVNLQRNDNISSAGSKYRVTCAALGMLNLTLTLEAETFNLLDLIE